ncbi:MAG: efflux RND transporter periplasmic adaptor subunit [Phycisphaerales bacterium]
MSSKPIDLSGLTRAGNAPERPELRVTTAVPVPPFAWRTRVLLPVVVLGGMSLVLLYTGWASMRQAVEVRVVPVVVKPIDPSVVNSGGDVAPGGPPDGVSVAQAPGWIEPDPFPIGVSALADGTVREVLVLEGQRVEAGQVVARMVDDDAKLAVAMIEGELAGARAAVAVAEADLDAARTNWENPIGRLRAVAVAEALVAESKAELERHDAGVALEDAKLDQMRDECDRLMKTVVKGAGADGELAQSLLMQAVQERALEQAQAHGGIVAAKLRQHEAELTAAREGFRLRIEEKRALAAAQAGLQTAHAHLLQDEVKREEAALRLSRMEVRAPVAGTVLSRAVEPGSRLMLESNSMNSTVALRLYDPSKLQVRVDIPLADAAKVGVGHRAEVTTEALPDSVFRGVVTRRMDEANIQKNTVQVKVAIENPTPVLRPEMLARVRFYPPRPGGTGATLPAGGDGAPGLRAGTGRVFVARDALHHVSDGRAHAWVVDRRSDTASLRTVTLGGTVMDGWIEALSGLNAGDRVIVDGSDRIREGSRVRVAGEAVAFNANGAATGHGIGGGRAP